MNTAKAPIQGEKHGGRTCRMMKYSTNVIALDALAGFRTYELLQRTRSKVCAQINTYKPPSTGDNPTAPKDIYYINEEDFDKQLRDSAEYATDEPIVVVANSLRKAKFVEKTCRRLNPAAVIKMYSGESTPDERKDFDNVNTAWANVDILIYTSTISAGCSFEHKRFHKLFAYFTSRSTDYITAIQMMGRVRNLESREYHIHIKNDSRDVPVTTTDLEKFLTTVNGVSTLNAAGIYSNLQNTPRYLNALGEREFTTKDLYYHTHIGNLRHKCLSQKYFLGLFIQAREDAGAIITEVNKCLQGPETVTEMRAEKKEIMKEIEVETMERLLTAPVPRDEEVDALQNSDQLTPEEIAGLHMYNLAEDYKVDVDTIDAAFLKKFDNPRAKTAWHNLNRFSRNGGDNLVDSADKMIEWNKRDDNVTTLADHHGNAELMKILLGLDIVNIVFDDMCRDINQFIMRYSHRAMLTGKIKEVITYLLPHMNVIKMSFSLIGSRLKNLENADLKRQLEFVNAILSNVFDMKISLDLRDRNMFYLKPSGKFIYNVENNCWRPKI